MKTALFSRLPEVRFWGNFPDEVDGFGNDTRTIQSGECFLALTAHRDGHDFLFDAERKGASCAIVSRIDERLALPQLQVPNVFRAAEMCAKMHRKNYAIISVAGSYGKTSTKDMLKLLLGERAYATPENFNNELGVTLSLSHMKGEAFGIIEGGIDRPGEMDHLIDLLQPDYSVMTGITPVHVSNFESFDQLVGEKCKILEYALSHGGWGILPENCSKYDVFRRLMGQCVVVGQSGRLSPFPHFTTFHLDEGKRVVLDGTHFQRATFTVPEMSLGQVENFAKAATVAKFLGLGDESIRENISRWRPSKMRGEVIFFRNHAVYLDSYNANPVSMMDALCHFDRKYPGPNTYVLGGMRELGIFSERYHRKLARYFWKKKASLVIAVGEEMEVFGERLRKLHAVVEVFHFKETEMAKEFFHRKMRGAIFIKGSQFYGLGELVNENAGDFRR